ncbi:1323_t:CDS:2 [Funneliformis geosporum]|uniref:1323_t:CDS:1 n=1 Tax=Funneliformis geosporum TaxID=1117311 RepID=A0A9W4SAH7_9GLOM|nr:1323_t:CDS:2 [Funneliformis geosporum]
MSKIANRTIPIPQNVKVNLGKEKIFFEGPLGKSKELTIPHQLEITNQEGNMFTKSENTALAGTYNSLISNLIEGVVKGYEDILEVKGAGFGVNLKEGKLEFSLGKSHLIYVVIPQNLKVKIERNKIIVKGLDKQEVRSFTANDIRPLCMPSVYKLSKGWKGIYYSGEEKTLKLKTGKSVKHITISSPQKVSEGRLAGFYACEVSLPEIGIMEHPFFSANPVETLGIAVECTKIYLQGLISRGYTISEVENAQYKKINVEEAVEEIGKMGYFSLSILQDKKKQEQKFKSREVLNYLQNERQIDKTIINRFSLGCIYDFFSPQKLIIPLANPEGKVVAFATRKIEEASTSEPKYKYLPSYHHYHKSSLLYNYHLVKKLRTEECYLVEGFFDVISLNKLGIENCLALLGTNLSEEQIRLLIELKKKIILFLDSDEAGQEATINVAVKLLLKDIDCEIVINHYGSDPDEICRQKDKAAVQDIISVKENPYLFILNRCFVK